MVDIDRLKRRNVLRGIGGAAAGGALAGCTGNGGGDGGDGGDRTPRPTEEPTPTPTPEPPSYNAVAGIVSFEMNQMPQIAAMRELLPRYTNDRMTGENRQFRGGAVAVRAFAAGELDYFPMSLGFIYQLQLSGTDMAVLAPKITGTDYVFVVNEQYDSLEAIIEADAIIGHAGPGGLSHQQIAGVFRESDQYSADDANLQTVGGSGTRTSALASGQIAAAPIHLDQFRRIKEQDAPVYVLYEMADIFPVYIQQAYAVRQDDLEDPVIGEHMRNYIDCVVAANDRAMTDFDWLHQQTQKYQVETLDRESSREAWEFQTEVLGTWPNTAEDYNEDTFVLIAEILRDVGIMTEDQFNQIDFDALINKELYNHALDNLDDIKSQVF